MYSTLGSREKLAFVILRETDQMTDDDESDAGKSEAKQELPKHFPSCCQKSCIVQSLTERGANLNEITKTNLKLLFSK